MRLGIIGIVLALAVLLAPHASVAASCGGAIPCSCGDEVTASRTLKKSVDPVVRTTCPGTGLVVANAGITLDLGGTTLKGHGVGTGVLINNGVGSVVVRNGKIAGFGEGLRGELTDGTTIDKVTVFDSAGVGITVNGDGITIKNSISRQNGAEGIVMTSLGGGGNTLLDSRSDQNGATGVTMDGGLLMARTVSSKNDGDGVSFEGITGARLDRNRTAKNEGTGYVLFGDALQVTRNRSNGNGVEAYNINTTNSSYIDNSASDDRVGYHDLGTGNVYRGNRCDQIIDVDSIPAGLC